MKRSIKGKSCGLVLRLSAIIALLRHFSEKETGCCPDPESVPDSQLSSDLFRTSQEVSSSIENELSASLPGQLSLHYDRKE